LKGNYSRITELRGVVFDWDRQYIHEHFKGHDPSAWEENNYLKNRSLGFIAQEIEKSVPEVVWTNTEGYKTVEYNIIVSIAVGAVKEQQSRIDSIYERINRLKKSVSA